MSTAVTWRHSSATCMRVLSAWHRATLAGSSRLLRCSESRALPCQTSRRYQTDAQHPRTTTTPQTTAAVHTPSGGDGKRTATHIRVDRSPLHHPLPPLDPHPCMKGERATPPRGPGVTVSGGSMG